MSKVKKELHATHPDHGRHLTRLKRVRGQIDGIERMIQARRYCPDIIVQFRAAESALRAIESEIFKTHLQQCVKSAMKESASDRDRKVDEIIKLIFSQKK